MKREVGIIDARDQGIEKAGFGIQQFSLNPANLNLFM